MKNLKEKHFTYAAGVGSEFMAFKRQSWHIQPPNYYLNLSHGSQVLQLMQLSPLALNTFSFSTGILDARLVNSGSSGGKNLGFVICEAKMVLDLSLYDLRS